MSKPTGIGDFISSFKGDSPGHPFRGNQYDGGGGESDLASKKPHEMTKSEFEKTAGFIHGTDEGGEDAINSNTFDPAHKVFKYEPQGMFVVTRDNPGLAKSYADQRARNTGKKPKVVYGNIREGAKIDVRDQANIIVHPSDFISHKRAITEALSRGEKVPDKVLAEYPDLKRGHA